MNERREARVLARHLDRLLQGQGGAAPSSTPPGVVDAELAALGELGDSLASIRFAPRPAHQATFERLLREYRPTLPPGGSTMSFATGGLPLLLILVTVVLFLAKLVLTRNPAPAPVRPSWTPTRVPTQATVPIQAPVRPLTDTLPSQPWRTPTQLWHTPTLSWHTPTLSPTATSAPTATWTPTTPVTPTAPSAPKATATPTIKITLTATTAPRLIDAPTKTVTPTVRAGRTGLTFHPEHLTAGGACRNTYSASGSLKNHGPGMATGIDVGHKIIDGAQWVDRVEISPASWTELGTSKPGRFTVYVHTNDDWPSAGKGAEIVVRLDVGGDTHATFSVKNQCKPAKPDKPEKPEKPNKQGKAEKAEKPNKPKKPKKEKGAHIGGEPSFWASRLTQLEI